MLDEMFAMNQNQVYERFGEPISTGVYDLPYLEYENKVIYMEPSSLGEDGVAAVEFSEGIEIFGIKLEADANAIKAKLGEPMSESSADEEGVEVDTLYYELSDYYLYFFEIADAGKYYLRVTYK